MPARDEAQARVEELERHLAALDCERAKIAARLDETRQAAALAAETDTRTLSAPDAPIVMASPTADKVALFRSLFRKRCFGPTLIALAA